MGPPYIFPPATHTPWPDHTKSGPSGMSAAAMASEPLRQEMPAGHDAAPASRRASTRDSTTPGVVSSMMPSSESYISIKKV